MSSHKGAVVSSFGQFIVKYHFQCLLVDNVQTTTLPTILSEQTHPNPLLLFNDKVIKYSHSHYSYYMTSLFYRYE